MTPIPVALERACNVARRLADIVLGKDQPEYLPLPATAVNVRAIMLSEDQRPIVGMVTRWELSAQDLEKVMAGHDLYLTVITGNAPFPPVALSIGEPEALPTL